MEPVQNKIIHCDTHSQTLIDGLGKLWKENQFCDITLKVEGEEFNCHKNVLAANSEYFTSVFARDFKEKRQKLITIPPEIEVAAFQTLLEYFYFGKLELSSENSEGVFRAADFMRLDTVVELSAEFLEDTLEKSNCVRRFIMIDHLQFKSPRVDSLRKAAARLIVENEETVSGSSEFLELSPEFILNILNLNSQPERSETLFLLIVKWVEHDEDNRQTFLSNFLQLIPVAGLSYKFFNNQMKTKELLRRNPQSFEWLFDCVVSQFANRICVVPDPPVSLVVVNRGSSRSCYQLQLANKMAVSVCDRPEITVFSAASYKRRIYLLCGKENGSSFRLSEDQKLWVESDLDLDFGCYSAGSILWEDDLYVVGGCIRGINIPDSITNLSAKYNFATQQRTSLPAMRKKRARPGVGLYGNSIFAACGYQASATIERYDPRQNLWCEAGEYSSNIDWCSSAVVGYSLYSCDVLSGRMQRFDFRSNRSENICSLPTEGRSYWITSMNDEIYAAQQEGGILKYREEQGFWLNSTSGCILKYDYTENCWFELHSNLDLNCPTILPWL